MGKARGALIKDANLLSKFMLEKRVEVNYQCLELALRLMATLLPGVNPHRRPDEKQVVAVLNLPF